MLDYFITEHPLTSFIAILAIVTAVAVGIVALPVRLAADYACAARAEILETDYQYGLLQGCWIRDKDGAWVEYSKIKHVVSKP